MAAQSQPVSLLGEDGRAIRRKSDFNSLTGYPAAHDLATPLKCGDGSVIRIIRDVVTRDPTFCVVIPL